MRSPSQLARAWIRLQIERPVALLAVALVTTLAAVFFASKLELKTAFGELLPQGKESVIVANQVEKRIVTASTLAIVARSDDTKALERFVDALAPKVKALGPDLVGNVDAGVKASRAFFDDHKLLYASLDDLKKVHDEVARRYDYEVAKAAGTLIDDSDPPPPITAKEVKDKLEEKKGAAEKAEEQFPDGYYLEKGGKMIVLLVRTPVSSGDGARAKDFMAKIRGAIDDVNPKRFAPDMRVDFTGDFVTAQEEYDQIKHDLSEVGVAGVLMILGVVFLFYLRFRTLLLMALGVGVGVAWTFGLAYLLIGHLNSSTGFLVSIVVGNGINCGIIYMARYLEARREKSAAESVEIAHKETWLSTLAAAGAATVSYGSLVVTDFRGFKHFGVIGGTGMLLCWTATYAFLPAMLMTSERIWPIKPESAFVRKVRSLYGFPFAFVARRFPRVVAVAGMLAFAICAAVTVRYLRDDPMEYDMHNVRSKDPKVASVAHELAGRIDPVIGRQGQEGVAILVDDVKQVLPLEKELEKKRDAAPEGHKPFDRVVTIFDLMPKDQDEKIALANETIDKLERAHKRRFISEADWKEIAPLLPKEKLTKLGVEDLPEQVARAFIEKDGTRGRLVYIVPVEGRSVSDAHYLIEWADSFRRTTLPDGSIVKGSGRSVIFADLILTVIEDAPKAILVSILGTLLVIALAFRGRRDAVPVFLTLALGIFGMVTVMALHGAKIVGWTGPIPKLELTSMKLNFLNFVALPISIGVGAEYAVNIMQRYRLAGPGEAWKVQIETGGAVILCSLTTTLGYLALTLSENLAIESFGVAAAAGEICCVVAAVLVLPAWLEWRRRRSA